MNTILILLLIVTGLAGITVGLCFWIHGLRKKVKNQIELNEDLIRQIKRISAYLEKSQEIQGEADEQKQELEKSSDENLIHRANNLFDD